MIRSVVHRPSWVPLRRGELFVSSMSSDGDLLSRDYRVRDAFGVGSGDSVVVRYGRIGLAQEVGKGLLWWAALEVLRSGAEALHQGG